MKKINIITLFVCGLLAFTACEDDNNSNPTFQDPTEFVLNTPAYASSVYDLKHSSTLELTCSQPNYSYTAATTYKVQLALSEFAGDAAVANYVTLATAYTTARMNVNASEFAQGLVDLWKASSSESFPTTPMKIYVRIKAALTSNGMGVVYSNTIELPQVLGYHVDIPVTLPAKMYMASFVNNVWDWDKRAEMVSVHSNPGKFWSVQYFAAGDQIKFNSSKTWDGNEVSYSDGLCPATSVTYAGITSSNGSITIGNAGWYIVVLSSTLNDRTLSYTLEFLEPNVYSTGNPGGGFDIFDETTKFTVPTDGTGEFISPAFVASGEMRLCIKLTDIDWWKTEFIILGGKLAYRATGGDQEIVTVAAGNKAYLNFGTGEGSVK
ncbi:SusF/SusE family outer membrane protein [Bacteroides ihuae]|uniref:SusF/SusE family outer membrane protein n=1 Tax=Bacteroides ihuae TaxID=1852362 RepID=UPI0008D9AAD4|nr:SusF/SusE family outer membrane protein [Bacteroides ihuae]